MKGFAIFLTVLICLLVGTAVTLLILIISLSRKIARTQDNVRVVRQRITDVTDTVTMLTSGLALFGGLVAKFNSIKRKVSKKDQSRGKK